MPDSRLWRGRARRLTLLVGAVTVPPAITLVVLGLALVRQDRAIQAQRVQESRRAALEAVVRSLQQSVAEARRYVTSGAVPDGMVRLTLEPTGISAVPASRALWLPADPKHLDSDDEGFRDQEILEYGGHETEALAAYQHLSFSASPAERAGALVRIGRILRRQGLEEEALSTYQALAHVTDVSVAGAPADLQGRRQRCAVLAELGQASDLKREASALEADLLAGRWRIDRPAWQLTAADLRYWLGRPVEVSTEAQLFSLTADALWRERGTPAKTAIVSAGGAAVTVLVDPTGESDVLAVSPELLSDWLHVATRGLTGVATAGLVDARNQLIGGIRPSGQAVPITAAISDTGLPWVLVVGSDPRQVTAAEPAGRAALYGIGIMAMLALIGGGGYMLWRVMRGELAVARLQTEFVSAVSHEFRTPLTALRHVTELLQEPDEMTPGARASFYEALDRNTRRLQRLVESLLNSSRLENSQRAFDFRETDIRTLVSDVVADFRAHAEPPGATLNLDLGPGGDLMADADRPALSNALWNLVDNAVKYSPERPAIDVLVRREASRIAIAVRDQGMGIPVGEQREILGRFVRGARAVELGIRGTGLGLALVADIVKQHGGELTVESAEGRGSTFTMLLPARSR